MCFISGQGGNDSIDKLLMMSAVTMGFFSASFGGIVIAVLPTVSFRGSGQLNKIHFKVHVS